MMASRALVTRSDAPAAAAAAQQQQEPLLHPSLEQGKAYLDALPYVDGPLNPVERATADRLVLEEMQNPRFPRKYVPRRWVWILAWFGLVGLGCRAWLGGYHSIDRRVFD
jgi:hypothetical protein